MKFGLIAFLFLFGLGFSTCTIPQVEDPRCTASRETVRSFFAAHFTNEKDAAFTREKLAREEKFFTPEFYRATQREFDRQEEFLKANPDRPPFITGDPFTGTGEFPTGFKIAECTPNGENKLTHIVRFFWKVESKGASREAKAEVEKRGEQWLISDLINNENKSALQLFNREKYSE